VRAFSWIIHHGNDPNTVILSEAPAKNFRPASFAGRARSRRICVCSLPAVGSLVPQVRPSVGLTWAPSSSVLRTPTIFAPP